MTRAILARYSFRGEGKQSHFATLAISASNAEKHSGAAHLADGSFSSLAF